MINHENTPPPETEHPIQRWISPPKGGTPCPWTSLRHAKFYAEFVGRPEIRQVRTGTGKQRGKRLLWLPDIYDFLMERAEAEREDA